MSSVCRRPHTFVIASLFVALAACSSSTTTPGGGSSGGSGTTDGTTGGDGGSPTNGGDGGASSSDSSSSSSSLVCCVNGKLFACPDKAAVDKCSPIGGIAECMAKCMGNPTCLQACQSNATGGPDTSACTRAASRDSECTPTCEGVQHTTTDKSCTSDQSCTSSEHCFAGKCYLSSAGAPCSSTDDCGNVAQCNSGCCEL